MMDSFAGRKPRRYKRGNAEALSRKRRESHLSLSLNLNAAATMGFAESGVCLGFNIFPRSMCNTGFVRCTCTGSPQPPPASKTIGN